MQNNTEHQPQWQQNVLREAAIKRLHIMAGNVNDMFYDYQLRQYITLPEYLRRLIDRSESLSFDLMGLWDQVDGLRFHETTMRDRFLKALQGPANPTQRKQAYDMAAPAAPASPDTLYPQPADLMAAARTVMQKERCVLILNHTQHLVTQPDHPDPQERS